MKKIDKINNLEKSLKCNKNIYIELFEKVLEESDYDIIAPLRAVDDLLNCQSSDTNDIPMEIMNQILQFYDFFYSRYGTFEIMMICNIYGGELPKIIKIAQQYKEIDEIDELTKYYNELTEEKQKEVKNLAKKILEMPSNKNIYALYDDYQEKFVNVINIPNTIEKDNVFMNKWLYLHIAYCVHTNGVLLTNYQNENNDEYMFGYAFTKKNIYPIKKESLKLMIEKVMDSLSIRDCNFEER